MYRKHEPLVTTHAGFQDESGKAERLQGGLRHVINAPAKTHKLISTKPNERPMSKRLLHKSMTLK